MPQTIIKPTKIKTNEPLPSPGSLIFTRIHNDRHGLIQITYNYNRPIKYYETSNWINGKRHGHTIVNEGKTKRKNNFLYEANCIHGKLHGLVRYRLSTGGEIETQYENDLKHGNELYFNSIKQLESTKKYDNDVLIQELTYHLTSDKTKIISTETNYQNRQKHGLYKSWYSNNNPMCQVPFHNGQKHGIAKDWYISGSIRGEVNYINGTRHGPYIEWSDSGRILIITEWIAGHWSGFFTTWNNNGYFPQTTFINPNILFMNNTTNPANKFSRCHTCGRIDINYLLGKHTYCNICDNASIKIQCFWRKYK